jgi:uncharacterized protein with HEPN domain
MQRDVLLLSEMIDAAEQAQQLTADITVSQSEADRQRRDALLWNFAVLSEAAGQLSAEVKDKFPDTPWQQPIRATEPDSPRLLVRRPGSPPHHRHRATTNIHG